MHALSELNRKLQKLREINKIKNDHEVKKYYYGDEEKDHPKIIENSEYRDFIWNGQYLLVRILSR